MGLFDRLRRQPPWKHADPAVRATAVEQLPLGEQEVIASIAREDPDARVRRAAVKKLYDTALVAAIAREDADAGVREEASGLVIDTALGAFEGTPEEESLRALELVADEKGWVAVAKQAVSERVARAALERVSDPHALGSIARRSEHASTRLGALARVADPAELKAIAVRSDYKDVTLAAIERAPERDLLEAVVARGKNKAAVRRAKALLREREEASSRAAQPTLEFPPPTAAVAPDPLQPWVDVCRRAEQVVAMPPERRPAGLEAVEAAWAALGAPPDDTLPARFASACQGSRDAIARHETERAEAERRSQETAAHVSERSARCEAVESLVHFFDTVPSGSGAARMPDGEEAASRVEEAARQLDEVRREWVTLSPLPDSPAAARLERRFESACRDVERRRAAWLAARDRHRALERLAAELEQVPDQASAETSALVATLRRAWTATAGEAPVDGELQARVDAVTARVKARESEERERRLRAQQEARARLEQACAQVETQAKAEGLTLKDGERLLRDARAALDRAAALPPPLRQEREALVDRLKTVQAALMPRVQELREADDWQRWANAGVQEELCRRVEALAGVEDVAQVAQQLREAQEQWKKVALAPRDRAQALWQRFKAAHDAVRPRLDAFFAAQAEERTAHLARKQALCEQAELLAQSSDWIRTAEQIKRLQVEWKGIGGVPRGQEKALWERFRAACDRFFTRRREDLLRRKDEWAANQARKQALIARVESLGEGGDWDAAVEEAKRIQAEWRAIGPVRKKHAEDLWERFKAACDRFAERYQQRDQAQMAANIREREEICAVLEALAAAVDPGQAPSDVADQVRVARSGWERAGMVPREAQAALGARYEAAVAAVLAAHAGRLGGTELDCNANLRRMEDLCARVEALAPTPAGVEVRAGETPVAILATRLRDALAARTIGGEASAVNEEAERRAAAQAVREAQAAWRRIGPAPADATRTLERRFHAACARVIGEAPGSRRTP